MYVLFFLLSDVTFKKGQNCKQEICVRIGTVQCVSYTGGKKLGIHVLAGAAVGFRIQMEKEKEEKIFVFPFAIVEKMLIFYWVYLLLLFLSLQYDIEQY